MSQNTADLNQGADAFPSREELLSELRELRARLKQIEERQPDSEIGASISDSNDVSPVEATGLALNLDLNQYHSLFHFNPNAVFTFDQEGRFIAVNPAGLEISGYSLEQLLGQSFVQFITSKTVEVAQDTFKRALAGETLVSRVSTIALDGHRIDFEVTAIPLRQRTQIVGAVAIALDITERLRVEKALRESEERHQAFVAQSSEAIWRYEVAEPFSIGLSVDHQLDLCYKHAYLAEANDVMARIYGFQKADDVIGKSLGELLPRTPENEDFLREFIASGYRVVDIESRRIDSSGQYRYYLSNMLGIVEDGLVMRAWGMRREVTEQKVWEESLRESEKRLSLALRAGNMGTWDWDLETDSVAIGPQTESILGLAPGTFEGTGSAMQQQVHPDDREEMARRVRRSIEQRVLYELEHRIIWPDGSVHWLSAVGAVVSDATGPATRMAGTCRDVTMRKRLEYAREIIAEASSLLASSLDYETTLQNVARVIVPSRADWCVIDLIEGGQQRRVAVAHADSEKEPWLWEMERVAAANGTSLFCTTQSIKTESLLLSDASDEYLRSHCPDEQQVNLVRLAGVASLMCVPLIVRERTIGVMTLASSQPQRRYDEHDLELVQELARRAATAVDNARLYREAQEVRLAAEHARQEAESANRAKDEFLAVVSHELRTPLTPMLGWLDLLRSQRLNPEESQRAFEIIQRNARTQYQLVNDLLDVSRIISGKLLLDIELLDPVSLVATTVESILPTAVEKGVSLTFNNELTGGCISGDDGRLQQVVWNLLSNAIKFTPASGTVDVTLTREDSGSEPRVCITVSDTGIGIDSKFIPYIFERFRQADASTLREFGGLGLGLAIVRHIITTHNGEIEAQSPGIGQGSTFRVYLPLVAEVDTSKITDTKNSSFQDSAKTDTALSGIRVLIVDDQADTREVFVQIMTAWGANVRNAGSIDEAFLLLQDLQDTWTPDVIISDISTPGANTFGFIRRLRDSEKWSNIPSIAITSYSGEEDSGRTLRAGYRLHLTKPVGADILCEAVQRLATDGNKETSATNG
jgi:PAS domain S-box-containing protein